MFLAVFRIYLENRHNRSGLVENADISVCFTYEQVENVKGEALSKRVRLSRYEVLEELDRIFVMSKGIRLRDLFRVVCGSSFSQIEFNIGNLEISFNNLDGLFDDKDDAEDRVITLSLEFKKEIGETRINRDYKYSVKELESFLRNVRAR